MFLRQSKIPIFYVHTNNG